MLAIGGLAVPYLIGLLAAGGGVHADDLFLLVRLYLGFIGRILFKDFRDVRGDILFGKFSLPGGRKTKTGAWSTDADTLDVLSRLCGEVALRTHSRTRFEDGRRGRTVSYRYVRVLPPELLRTLPEWRALVLRTNLSPVIVRLRMAWRRWDYRRASRMAMSAPRQIPIPVASQPRSIGRGPDPGSQGRNGQDPPPLPPPFGDDPNPRPRRPWDPPANPEDGTPAGFGDDQ